MSDAEFTTPDTAKIQKLWRVGNQVSRHIYYVDSGDPDAAHGEKAYLGTMDSGLLAARVVWAHNYTLMIGQQARGQVQPDVERWFADTADEA